MKVKNRPAIPDNEDYWQVFEGDKHIDDFLQSKNDFAILTSTSIHEENCLNEEQIPETELSFSTSIKQFENIFEAELFDNPDPKGP